MVSLFELSNKIDNCSTRSATHKQNKHVFNQYPTESESVHAPAQKYWPLEVLPSVWTELDIRSALVDPTTTPRLNKKKSSID